MNSSSPMQAVRKMIEEFQIPQNDALEECLLSYNKDSRTIIDAGIFISTKQSERFYRDIFHFWVRAFFCFVEDMSLGSFFREAAPFIACKEISAEKFREHYLALLSSRTQDSHFVERQQNKQTHVDVENRTFSQAYMVLDRPNIQSAVALSDGEYVAYFKTMPKANH